MVTAGAAPSGAAAATPPARRKRLLSREELADIEYLFDRLSGEEAAAGDPAAARVPVSPANSPLPLPILPAEPGGLAAVAPTRNGNNSSNQPPTVGLAQLKFALRAFGLPVRKADVVAILQRHGYVPGGGEEEGQQEDGKAAAAAATVAAHALRLSRAAFRELVGHALRDGLPGGRREDMARVFALLDRGGKGRVTRDDVAAAAAGALGRDGAAALGGDKGLADMLALFSSSTTATGVEAAGLTLDEFAAGMSAVSLGRIAGMGLREAGGL